MSSPKNQKKTFSRRRFLAGVSGAAAAGLFPAIVPARVLGAEAPSKRINVACIGVGRKGLGDMKHAADLKGKTQIVAVCDVDSKRANNAKERIDKFYGNSDCAAYGDFREIAGRNDIDAVVISTPDHWHALPAIAAARSGKSVFVQKPMSLTIEEGRAMTQAMDDSGKVFQVGSQQRSDVRFQLACRLVREGRIGKLQTIKVGIGIDPGCGEEPVMPVPGNLDYDFWLGQAPLAEYTEKRVHPDADYGRPGWLRIRDYGAGMITGWGAHHLDVAHWGMGMERSGPIEVEGWGKFPESGLWNVHGEFDLTYRYANGVAMNVAPSSKNPQGVRFEGEDGWIFVSRADLKASDDTLLAEAKDMPKGMSDKEDAAHMEDFIDAIREGRQTLAPAEIAHRSCSACLIGAIVMELGRKVQWNPEKEQFISDDEANAKVSRPMRAPWSLA